MGLRKVRVSVFLLTADLAYGRVKLQAMRNIVVDTGNRMEVLGRNNKVQNVILEAACGTENYPIVDKQTAI